MKKQLVSAVLATSLILGGSFTILTPASHAAEASVQALTGTIVNSSPYFHSTPQSGGPTMGFVKKGSVVQVLEVTNKWWVKINYNGTAGWVSSNYIVVNSTSVPTPPPVTTPAPAPAAQKADKLIDYAKSLIGKVEYGYAKRDTSNPNRLLFDCSSYTQYVFKQALGINMGWGANAQYKAFPHVAKANLQKGDLVFFSVGTPGVIGHVGIYIGDGKFIHNLKPSADVLISDLSTGYWKNHYIDGARAI